MSTTQGPELHLDVYVSGQYDPLQLLDVSTSKGHELQMNIPRRQKPVLLRDLSTLHRPVLLTKVPSHWVLSFTWTCLHYRGLCCTWNYLWSIGAWAAHRLVCTKKLPNILSRLQQVQVKLQHAQTGSKMSACNMLEDAATYSAAPRLNRLQYVLLQNARTGGKMSGCNMLEQAAILCCTL